MDSKSPAARIPKLSTSGENYDEWFIVVRAEAALCDVRLLSSSPSEIFVLDAVGPGDVDERKAIIANDRTIAAKILRSLDTGVIALAGRDNHRRRR